MEPDQEPAKASRVAGVRYPGAPLAKVLDMLNVLDAAGGRASVGHIAPRISSKESSSRFRSVTAAARSFGLADWHNGNPAVFTLTDRGAAAIGKDVDARAEALRLALVEPAVFAEVVGRLGGRTVNEENLTEAFRLAGVSPAGAGVAASTFLESARTAGAVGGTPEVLDHDLPVASGGDGSRSKGRKDAGRGGAPALSRTAPPVAHPRQDVSVGQPPNEAPPAAAPAGLRSSPGVNVSSGININIEIHIAADATAATIEEIFRNMRKYVLGGSDGENAGS